jgi:hypothetical protein
MVAQNTLTLTADTSSSQKSLVELQAGYDKTNAAVASMAKSLDNLSKSQDVQNAQSDSLISQFQAMKNPMGQVTLGLNKLGAEYDKLKESVKAYQTYQMKLSTGKNTDMEAANAEVQGVAASLGNLISVQDIATARNKLQRNAVKLSAEDMQVMYKAAYALSRQTGEDIGEVSTRLTNSISKGTSEAMMEYGLFTAELTGTKPQKVALMLDTLRQQFGGVTVAAETLAEKSTRSANMQEQNSLVMAASMEKHVLKVEKLKGQYKEWQNQIKETALEWAGLDIALSKTKLLTSTVENNIKGVVSSSDWSQFAKLFSEGVVGSSEQDGQLGKLMQTREATETELKKLKSAEKTLLANQPVLDQLEKTNYAEYLRLDVINSRTLADIVNKKQMIESNLGRIDSRFAGSLKELTKEQQSFIKGTIDLIGEAEQYMMETLIDPLKEVVDAFGADKVPEKKTDDPLKGDREKLKLLKMQLDYMRAMSEADRLYNSEKGKALRVEYDEQEKYIKNAQKAGAESAARERDFAKFKLELTKGQLAAEETAKLESIKKANEEKKSAWENQAKQYDEVMKWEYSQLEKNSTLKVQLYGQYAAEALALEREISLAKEKGDEPGAEKLMKQRQALKEQFNWVQDIENKQKGLDSSSLYGQYAKDTQTALELDNQRLKLKEAIANADMKGAQAASDSIASLSKEAEEIGKVNAKLQSYGDIYKGYNSILTAVGNASAKAMLKSNAELAKEGKTRGGMVKEALKTSLEAIAIENFVKSLDMTGRALFASVFNPAAAGPLFASAGYHLAAFTAAGALSKSIKVPSSSTGSKQAGAASSGKATTPTTTEKAQKQININISNSAVLSDADQLARDLLRISSDYESRQGA